MVFSVTSMVIQRGWQIPSIDCRAIADCGCELRLFQTIQRRTPTKDEILSRANDAFAAGQYIKAEKDYREVLRVTPNDPGRCASSGPFTSHRVR